MEKPKATGLISAGFFVFDRRVLDYLDGPECILEREPMERLAREGQLMAYRHDGFFYAMDTYREYQHLNELDRKSTRLNSSHQITSYPVFCLKKKKTQHHNIHR